MLSPWLLVLLSIPGCFLVKNHSKVNGIMGESLNVQCPYEEEHRMHGKYLCKGVSRLVCFTIVAIKGSEEEEKNGRVSIRDSRQNCTFTVTMENLAAEDAGSYACGINKFFNFDHLLWFTVSISPAPKVISTTTIQSPSAAAETSGTSTPAHRRDGETTFPTSGDGFAERIEILLPFIFAVLLVLFVGVSLLAWAILLKQKKAGDNSEVRQNSNQVDLCYSLLEFQPRTLDFHPAGSHRKGNTSLGPSRPRSDKGVEYSQVVTTRRKDVNYATLNLHTTYDNLSYPAPKTKQTEETAYCEIKTT
ncbi:CMRF35-like molecule 8 [Tachyglossus aculeatus]|uniref:CMRF35-like molecule 8 n=1 Tax=Tachyglossus aculeatus TaxID=9261 RepID=UPI0018F53B0C|nr:CMRF35-like molecule 8 [Tachyglossus aculeatus]